MPVTLLLVPRIQNAIYTLFHPIQTKGADYAHHNTMGLVWLKFKLAPLCMVSIQEQVMMARMQ